MRTANLNNRLDKIEAHAKRMLRKPSDIVLSLYKKMTKTEKEKFTSLKSSDDCIGSRRKFLDELVEKYKTEDTQIVDDII